MNTAMRQYGCDSPNRTNNINSLNNLIDSVLGVNTEHSSSSESLVGLLNAGIKRQSQSINVSMHKSLNTSESVQEGRHYLSTSAKKHKKSDSEMGTDIFLNIYNTDVSSVLLHKKKKFSESSESVAEAEVNLSKHKKKKKKHKEESSSNDESKKKVHLADLDLIPTRASKANKNTKNMICFSGDIIPDSSVMDNSAVVEQTKGKKHKIDTSVVTGQTEEKKKKHKTNPEINEGLVNAISPILNFEHNSEGKKKHKKRDKVHTSTSLEDNGEAVEQSVGKKHKVDTSGSETAVEQSEGFEHNSEGKKKHKKKDKMHTNVEGNSEAVEKSVGKKHKVDTSGSETAAGQSECFEPNLEGKKKHKKKDKMHSSTSLEGNNEAVEQSVSKKHKVDTSTSETAAAQSEGFEHNLEGKKKHKKKDKMHTRTSIEGNSETVEQTLGETHKVDTSKSETAAGQTEGFEHNSEGKKKHKKKDKVNTSTKLESSEVSSCNETNSEEPKRAKKQDKQQDTVEEPTCTKTMELKKKKRKKHLQEFEEGSLDGLIMGRISTCEELDVQKNNKMESNCSIISNDKNKPEPSTPLKQKNTSLKANLPQSTPNVSSNKKKRLNSSDPDSNTDKKSHTTPQKSKKKRKEMKSRIRLDSESTLTETDLSKTLEVNDEENPVSFKSPESIKLNEKTPLKQKNTSLQANLPQSTANVSSEKKKRLNSSDHDSSTDKKSQTTPQTSNKKRKEIKSRMYLDSESSMTETDEEDLSKRLEVNDHKNSFKSPESIKLSEKTPLKPKNTSLQANFPQSTANVSSKKKKSLNSSDPDSSTDKKSQTTPQTSTKKRKAIKIRLRLDSESTMTETDEEDLSKSVGAKRHHLHPKNKDKRIYTTSESENDTKAKYEQLVDALHEALDRNRLTAEETEVLKNLRVDLTFDIPVSHMIETRMSSCPTRAQQAKFKSLEVKLRTGPYTSVEDQIIKDNWADFCKTHHLPDKPAPFFTFKDGKKNLLPEVQRIAFVQYLGRNLPHRMLYSIYKRFKMLFQPSKKGKFTPEEDHTILIFMEHSSLENKFSALSQILQRSRTSIKKHYDMLCTNDDIVKWNLQLKEQLIENLMEVTGQNVVDDLKDFTIEMIHWQKIEHKMNIPAAKLREKWITHIYPRLFVQSFNTTEVQEKLINILYDNYDDDFKAVSWNEVALDFEGMTGRSLYKIFMSLVRKRVPGRFQKSFKNSVDYLKHQYLMDPEKKMKSKFRRLSYKEGKLIQEYS